MKKFILILMLAVFFNSASFAGVGGYMSDCAGSSFVTGKICLSKDSSGELRLDSQHAIAISATAQASYTAADGQSLKVDLVVNFEDDSNYLQPEASLPVVIRIISARYHRDFSYRTQSNSRLINRTFGTRKFKSQTLTVALNNNWGAEEVETVEKIEVLVAGFPGVATLNF